MMMRMQTLALSTVLLAMSAAVQGQAPPDFGLRLTFGCAIPDVLDTFNGTYTRTMSKGGRTAKITISSGLKDQLFNLVNETRFFETPEHVSGLGLCEPTSAYLLHVKSGGRVHEVRWDDCHSGEPDTDEGRRMRALAEGVVAPSAAMRSVRRLPMSDLICM